MDARAWDERYRETPHLWRRGPNQFVLEEVSDRESGTALDLASGEGRNAIWLAERGWRVTAVDFSRVATTQGRQDARAAGVDVQWVEADVLEYQPTQTHDLVLIAYLQLPEAEMRIGLDRAAAAVAPGGLLLVIAHARKNLAEGYGGPQDPALLFEPEQLASWVPELRVERAEHVKRVVETDEGPRPAIDVIVRAVRPD